MTPFLLVNFVDASDKTLYRRRIYIDLGIKDFDSSLCWIMQNYPVKLDAMYGFKCQTDMTDVTALRHPINQCISGTAAKKMGYATEGTIDTLNSLCLCLCYCACRCSGLLFQRDKTIRDTRSKNT
jgi:hypothetical protein